ncbi:conserved hypothetical protein [uncultured delta proteobacterium]|uniref:Uncharacterized protein n=1 Tax=uncultured delta proteobacterium TaxID=34034 RepID=A0A212JI64_9DELT|nr:conserved hypothetical protein [uncultured delta proteobacterium]
MNGIEITQALEILTGIVQVLDKLGIGGLVLLVLSGPALVVLAVLVIEYHRSVKQRAENAAMLAAMREENARSRDNAAAQLEAYRADTQQLVRDLGANQRATDQYYKDNVELAKNYKRLAEGLQDVVVGNTRALERLIVMLEGRNSAGKGWANGQT